MKIVNTLFLVVILSACSTTAKFNKKMDSWIGHTEAELVTIGGMPDKTYPLPNGTKVIGYISEEHDCQQMFVVNPAGTIVSWHSSGTWCVSH